MFTTGLSLGEGPPLIQDGDPRVLTLAADETGLAGWQAWPEPTLGAPYLWVASFSASHRQASGRQFLFGLTSEAWSPQKNGREPGFAHSSRALRTSCSVGVIGIVVAGVVWWCGFWLLVRGGWGCGIG